MGFVPKEDAAEAEMDLIGVRDSLMAARKRLERIRHESRHADSTREIALSITKIEEALLWLKAAGHAGVWGE